MAAFGRAEIMSWSREVDAGPMQVRQSAFPPVPENATPLRGMRGGGIMSLGLRIDRS